MFCSDSNQQRTERDLLRNLKRTSANNPSIKSSMLKSFVKDLCFWEINKFERLFGIDEHNDFCAGESHNRECLRSKKQKSIPTMKEAIDLDNQYEHFTDVGSDNSTESSTFSSSTWKTAIDLESGKIYYYDTISRKTQWKKPSRLKHAEKEKKKERRRIARQFFSEMENNILDSISRGEVIPGIQLIGIEKEYPPKESLPNSHVRTISAMCGVLLEELDANLKTTRQDQYNYKEKSKEATSQKARGQNSALTGRPPLPGQDIAYNTSSSSCNITQQSGINDDIKLSSQKMEESIEHHTAEQSELDFDGENSSKSSIKGKSYKINREQSNISSRLSIGHTRRNTEGTIYVQNTMANPDVKATIKCICGVFRAHIRQSIKDKHNAQKKKAHLSLEYNVFDDNFGGLKRRRSFKEPTLTEISEFYEAFYQRSQMEHDTIILSLIYVERLIKFTNGILAPSPQNWRSLLFSCMVLASKVWDDFSMWNYDFANVTAHTTGLKLFTLSRINELELALLKCLKFNVKVPASEYAKYYFLIRTMLLRSGLVKEDKTPMVERDASQNPEILNSPSFDQWMTKEFRDRRTKSMDGRILKDLEQERSYSADPVFKDSVYLEQLIR